MTDKKLIHELLERNKAKPLKKMYFAPGYDPLPSCPNCGDALILTSTDKFCRKCGQRLMTDAWEL